MSYAILAAGRLVERKTGRVALTALPPFREGTMDLQEPRNRWGNWYHNEREKVLVFKGKTPRKCSHYVPLDGINTVQDALGWVTYMADWIEGMFTTKDFWDLLDALCYVFEVKVIPS